MGSGEKTSARNSWFRMNRVVDISRCVTTSDSSDKGKSRFHEERYTIRAIQILYLRRLRDLLGREATKGSRISCRFSNRRVEIIIFFTFG